MTTVDASATPAADPAAVWRAVDGFVSYWALAAAVDLDLFTALDARASDAADLADRLGAVPERLAMLLDVLAGLGFLTRRERVYELTPTSEAFLVAGGPSTMRELVLRSPGPHENWPALTATLRGAHPPVDVDDPTTGFLVDLVRATFPTQLAVAARTADVVGAPQVDPCTVLDLGAGAAPWTAALLDAWPTATAVVNDRAAVLVEAARTLRERGLQDRARLLEGDYRTVVLPDADVVVLGHVCRSEGEDGAPALVRRATAALRPGGLLVVADYVVDDDLAASTRALLLGLTMVAATEHGRTFTEHDYRRWLTDAGLDGIRRLEPFRGTDVMIASKPDDADSGRKR